jgi:hypothetical protein
LRVAQRDAEEEARVAFNALTTARVGGGAELGVEAQRATRDIYAQQSDLGKRGLLDLLDAENELFLARSNLVTANFTEPFAVYRVLAVIGTFLNTLDIERPKEAINIYRLRPEPVRESAHASTRPPPVPPPSPARGATAPPTRPGICPGGRRHIASSSAHLQRQKIRALSTNRRLIVGCRRVGDHRHFGPSGVIGFWMTC